MRGGGCQMICDVPTEDIGRDGLNANLACRGERRPVRWARVKDIVAGRW